MARPNKPQPPSAPRALKPRARATAATVATTASRPRSPNPTRAASERRRLTQQLRALAHPLRLKLIEMFARGPRTTMQVAAQLGEPPTRLYHHVNALERAGLLKLTRTRQVRGTTEKYYVVTRRRIGVGSSAGDTAGARAAMHDLTTIVFEQARDDLLATLERRGKFTPETAPVALRMAFHLPPSELPKVRARIMKLVRELKAEYRNRHATPDWALTLGLAPIRPSPKSTG